MTYARTIARHAFRASAYALSGRARLLMLKLLILEIACLDAWLAGVVETERSLDVFQEGLR